MIPLDVFGSESVAADLLQQVRWRDGVSCPRCRSDRTVRNGSYGHFQRYLCKDCDRTFNDKTGTIFAHSKIPLRRWLFSIYAFLQFNTSLRQLQYEIDVTHKTIHQHIERFTRALDAPSLNLVGPVEIDEVYISAGKKGRERDVSSRSRGLSWTRLLFRRQTTRVHPRGSWDRSAIRDSSESRRRIDGSTPAR
jgi:transposase-like protein